MSNDFYCRTGTKNGQKSVIVGYETSVLERLLGLPEERVFRCRKLLSGVDLSKCVSREWRILDCQCDFGSFMSVDSN